MEVNQGAILCPTCHRPYDTGGQVLVLDAIAAYLVATEDRTSADAIQDRLDHVVAYISHIKTLTVTCAQVDAQWIAAFRKWMEAIPVVSPAGNLRDRALSTVENSVVQLAAAFRHSRQEPNFKPINLKSLSTTPSFRADVATIGRMFAWAIEKPKYRWQLLQFLRVSVLTLARPDAAHDISVAPSRKQWDAAHHVLNLNPRNRRQTKKYRATIPIAKRGVPLFDQSTGFLVTVKSVKKAMRSMASDIGLPGDGEAGMKVIRRSMANIVRRRLRERDKSTEELEVFLGHRVIDPVSELYAPFDPSYLTNVRDIIDEVVGELETAVPGAFTALSPHPKNEKALESKR